MLERELRNEFRAEMERAGADGEPDPARERIVLVELVSQDDLRIYERFDNNSSVRRVRRGERAYVEKRYKGELDALTERECESMLKVSNARLKWTAGLDGYGVDAATATSRLRIVSAYAGLDLMKWEVLLGRCGAASPFRQAPFLLALSAGLLRVLGEFHEAKERSFVHCDLKADNVCCMHVDGLRLAGDKASGFRLEGGMDLGRLTLIDLGLALTVKPEDRPAPIVKNHNGEYLARSYKAAFRMAVKDRDTSGLKHISWKADLYSLGAMLEGWVTHLAGNGPGDVLLRDLPRRLKAFDDLPDPLDRLPHGDLIREIEAAAEAAMPQAQLFVIPLLDDEVAMVRQRLEAVPVGSAEPASLPIPPKTASKSAVFAGVVAGLAAVTLASWGAMRLASQDAAKPQKNAAAAVVTPPPKDIQTAATPPPRVTSVDDPLFQRCASLRPKDEHDKTPVTRQRYEAAITDCGAVLSAGAAPGLAFKALMYRSAALEKTDRLGEAMDDMRQAGALDPAEPGVDLVRALLLYRQGQAPAAFHALDSAVAKGWRERKLIETDPDYRQIVADDRYRGAVARMK